MPATRLQVPLNRVEGDLELRVELNDGVVTDAWCSGTMYRGIEKILQGRGALDGLVITPRVCGICSTSHLTAAVRALDELSGATVPADAQRLRNVALIAENIQSDVRHAALMFGADMPHASLSSTSLYEEAVRRYEPFRGSFVVESVSETRKPTEILGILAGQWPHPGFMVPGGVTCLPSPADLLHCRLIARQYREWYERRILGCTLERWAEVRSSADLDAWLEQSAQHRDGELGFFVRYARAIGLDKLGKGHASFISYGSLPIPEDSSVTSLTTPGMLVAAGFVCDGEKVGFDQRHITEHLAHSWFVEEGPPRHPFDGETRPYASGSEGQKYSWAKAPRYMHKPAETGALAERMAARDLLMTDLVHREGANAFVRQLARLTRPATLMPALETWLTEIKGDGHYFTAPEAIDSGSGSGLLQASRGALGHWVQIKDGEIERYQIITPTTWNASPRDDADVRGPIEQAMIGTPVRDPSDPVELGFVARSFDPCLVCTVHTLRRGDTLSRTRLGAS